MLSKQSRNGFMASVATIAGMACSLVLLAYDYYWVAVLVFMVSAALYLPFMRIVWPLFMVVASVTVSAQTTPSVLQTPPSREDFRKRVDGEYKAMEWTYISLNTLDLATTLYGLNNGAVEGNALLRNHHPVALCAIKASGTAFFLVMNRQVYKNNPRAARVLLFSANLLYGAVVGNTVGVVLRLNK